MRLAKISEGDTVLEIGPGRGALTHRLLKAGARVIAVEVDPDMVSHLQSSLGEKARQRLQLIHADVLRVDWPSWRLPDRCKAVGNLPYNIATAIIHQMMEIKHRFQSLVFMLQKEVASRVMAGPDDADYGYFSVLCHYHFEAEAGFDVPPGAFRPPPRVRSHVLRLRPKSSPSSPASWAPLEGLLRKAFAHRRKTLLNNLRSPRLPAEQVEAWLTACGVPPKARAQELNLEQFLCLARMLQSPAEDDESKA